MTFISFARPIALSESCILGDPDGRSVLSLLLLDSPGQFHPSFFPWLWYCCCFHAPIRTLPSSLAIANESVHTHSLSSLAAPPSVLVPNPLEAVPIPLTGIAKGRKRERKARQRNLASPRSRRLRSSWLFSPRLLRRQVPLTVSLAL